MNIVRLMLLSRQMKNRRHEKNNTMNGIPPLTFNAIAGALKNYRIYGDTVNGESVGDRTKNLFDKNMVTWGEYLNENGTITEETAEKTAWASNFIPVTVGESYTLNKTGSRRGKFYKADKTPYQTITMDFSGLDENNTFTIPETVAYIRFTIYRGYTTPNTIMLNTGSEALPYEPYGYKVPVTVSDGTDTQTTTIYLDAPLTKSGNIADYIDYAAQKRRNSDGTESSVTLPEIAVAVGTNTLTVGTEVQPSRVELMGRIKEAQINGSGNT